MLRFSRRKRWQTLPVPRGERSQTLLFSPRERWQTLPFSPSSVFPTRSLWGLGSTAPYLHDGRAKTVTEAILEHGGEAAASSAAFQALPTPKQKDLVAFLESLVLFKLPEPP